MKGQYMIVYFIMALILACVFELIDIAFKWVKKKIKAKKLEKAQQSIKEE